MYQKILVPMALDHDISPRMLAIASALCAEGGQVIALHVYEPPRGTVAAYVDADKLEGGARQAREKLAEKTRDIPNLRADLVSGQTYRSILEYATQHDVDCIVIGSHRPGFSDFLLGSTAARVVRHANCDVHVCRTS